jgi:hypothetical protein
MRPCHLQEVHWRDSVQPELLLEEVMELERLRRARTRGTFTHQLRYS